MSRLRVPFKSIAGRKILVPLIVLIIIIGSGLLILFSSKGLDLGIGRGSSDDPNADAERVVKEVEKIYLLPDEVPTLATVSDKNQLADQVFFKNAENGDKVLIYSTASIAILYRPSLGKIINVGPISVDTEQIEANAKQQEPTPVEEEELSNVQVLILNGTTTVGLTQQASDELEDTEFVSISDRDDAANKPYPDTVVIYTDSSNKPQADEIAKVFSSSVAGKLPEGESANGADIVIILGEDYAENSN